MAQEMIMDDTQQWLEWSRGDDSGRPTLDEMADAEYHAWTREMPHGADTEQVNSSVTAEQAAFLATLPF